MEKGVDKFLFSVVPLKEIVEKLEILGVVFVEEVEFVLDSFIDVVFEVVEVFDAGFYFIWLDAEFRFV